MTNEEAIADLKEALKEVDTVRKIYSKQRKVSVEYEKRYASLSLAIKALEQAQLDKTYDKILEHILEVKRIAIDEYGECNRQGYSSEVFRKMGYIESLKYIEEYIKNLKEDEE